VLAFFDEIRVTRYVVDGKDGVFSGVAPFIVIRVFDFNSMSPLQSSFEALGGEGWSFCIHHNRR